MVIDASITEPHGAPSGHLHIQAAPPPLMARASCPHRLLAVFHGLHTPLVSSALLWALQSAFARYAITPAPPRLGRFISYFVELRRHFQFHTSSSSWMNMVSLFHEFARPHRAYIIYEDVSIRIIRIGMARADHVISQEPHCQPGS